MKKIATILAMGVMLGMAVSTAALADPPHGDGHWHGDIHHFRDYDMNRWRGGYWTANLHDGRRGWWWVVGGEWYYYPVPVYPYPDPYVPPTVVVQQPAQVQTNYWYCGNPQGYYPYIAACYVPWQAVPIATQSNVVPPSAASIPVTAEPELSQREKDDRALDTFAAEFYKTDMSENQVDKHLESLLERVEKFRQELFDRKYNAMDILRDTENLEKRIAKKRAEKATHS